MSWEVACYCGHRFYPTPPAACPACGEPVTDGRDPATDQAWLALIHNEMGTAGTTSYDPTHETW